MGPVVLNAKDKQISKRLKAWGFAYPKRTIGAARKSGLPLSYALATLRMETTNGSNRFGHDGTTSIPNRWKGQRVTFLRYRHYKRNRRKHGAQGVGPTQLTYPPFQDHADSLGGCWRPYVNMFVGFSIMKNNIDKHGKHNGARSYNGSGPDAEAYARAWMGYQKLFHTRLVQNG